LGRWLRNDSPFSKKTVGKGNLKAQDNIEKEIEEVQGGKKTKEEKRNPTNKPTLTSILTSLVLSD